MIDLSDYYSGGYFLIRADKPDWPQLDNDLLPGKLISLSECICPRLSVFWGWLPGNKKAALAFGIPETRLDAFIDWCRSVRPSEIDNQSEIDLDAMFGATDVARRFVQAFLPDTDGLHIIGVGLLKEMAAVNWREESDEKLYGVEKRIRQHLPMEPGGTILGFEVVSFSYHDYGHSWLCGRIDQDMHKLFSIRPNQHGLIDTLEEARKVYDWIAEDEMQGRRSEPEPYDFWLLVSYPLTVE